MSGNFISLNSSPQRGDPRMNGAINVRSPAEPTGTATSLLLDALLQEGSFELPRNHSPYTNDSLYAKGLSPQDDKGIDLHHEHKTQLEERSSGLPRTIFAGMSDDTMAVKGTFESTAKTEKDKENTDGTSNIENDNVSMSGLDVARSLLVTTSQEEEDTTDSTSPTASNDTSTSDTTSNLPPNSAFVDNEMLTSILLKQLTESSFKPSNDFYHPALLSTVSGVAGNNVSSSDFLLHSTSLLHQMVRQQQIQQQHKVSNRYNTIPEYQQLPDALKDLITSALSQKINAMLEEEHHHSMYIYQQLQNQVNDLQENYSRMIEGIRLHQEQRRKHRRLRRTKRTRKRSSNSTDQPQVSQKPSKRKYFSHVETICSEKNQIEERKERKKRKKSKRSHKEATTNSDDDSTIKTSSPRLESALKRFNAKFDKLTLSCMEEVGYNGEECDELLPTFQNEVIRDSRYRKSRT